MARSGLIPFSGLALAMMLAAAVLFALSAGGWHAERLRSTEGAPPEALVASTECRLPP